MHMLACNMCIYGSTSVANDDLNQIQLFVFNICFHTDRFTATGCFWQVLFIPTCNKFSCWDDDS